MKEFKLPAKGFTFTYGGKDVFVVTDYEKKSKILAKKILRKLLLPENPDTINEILYWLMPGEINIKSINGRGCMWDIHGRNFGGRGSWLHDGNTIVIDIWKEETK